MTVIINEFEIVSNAEPAHRERDHGSSTGGEGIKPPPLRPWDVERIVLHQHHRRERLRAD